MSDTLQHLNGTPVLLCAADGRALRDEGDANDLIAAAWQHEASWVAIPTERLEDEFFQLRTRIAGDFFQKFVNYRMGVAILGDISRHTAGSGALRDFVRESNQGRQVWFLDDTDALRRRFEETPTRG